MKKPIIIILALGLLFVGIGLAPSVRVFFSRSIHSFPLTDSPALLTEELALARARDALAADVAEAAGWHPRRSNSTAAPDQFMERLDERAGRFIFTNATDSARIVLVKLDGSRIVCHSSIAK